MDGTTTTNPQYQRESFVIPISSKIAPTIINSNMIILDILCFFLWGIGEVSGVKIEKKVIGNR